MREGLLRLWIALSVAWSVPTFYLTWRDTPRLAQFVPPSEIGSANVNRRGLEYDPRTVIAIPVSMSDEEARAEISAMAHAAVLAAERPVMKLALYRSLTPPAGALVLFLTSAWI